MRTEFVWKNLKEVDILGDLRLYEKITLKCILKKYEVNIQIGLISLKIGSSGEGIL
jgi:hypothetical protein